MNWTEAQRDAIDSKGNVIVTAAAGSGKTAVLVQRVIEKLCDPISPVSADRLLIVTFTNAAAAEMRQRIEKELADRCAKEPDNIALLKQQLLISAADICTIDSFCIRLVRNNFSRLGISPDFKIADKPVYSKIRQSVLQSVFDEYFKNKDEDFITFLNITDSIYGHDNAMKFVEEIMDYCQKLPQGMRWLDDVVDSYNPIKIDESVWVKAIMSNTADEFKHISARISAHLDRMVYDEGLFDAYDGYFRGFIAYFEDVILLAKNNDWNGFVARAINPPEFVGKFNCPRGSDKEGLFEPIHDTHKKMKTAVNELKNAAWKDENELKKQFELCYKVIKKIAEIVLKVIERYYAELDKRSLATFTYISVLTMKLLTDTDESGELVPSEFSKEISAMYDEVMVDEYQDINNLQGKLFEIISDGGKKLFTVGDVKQSIYGFRGSNPENFSIRSDKAQFFSKDLADDVLKRVVLSNNFRSRGKVCDFINAFFILYMTKQTGGVEYDSNEMLDPAAKYPENGIPAVETHIIEGDGALKGLKDEDKLIPEAEFLGDYILKTMEEPAFLMEEDPKKKSDHPLRKARFGDFTVLMRDTKSLFLYVKALKNRGIPVSVGSGDFFKTTEILTALSLIKAIQNPMDDISMLAVMLSPIFGFTEDDVAGLKFEFHYNKLYSSVLKKAAQDDKLCLSFSEKINKWRNLATYTSTPDLISTVFTESGYYDIVLSMSDPKRRQTNLILFEQFAEDYYNDCCGDLSGFIEHLRYLEDSDTVKSGASSDGDAVTFMTVHHSKGLQFPITIIANCQKEFFKKEADGDILFSGNMGIAFKYVDDEKNAKYDNIGIAPIAKIKKAKQIDEEMRLLYVAMTRAKERLVLLISGDDLRNKILKYPPMISDALGDDDRFLPQVITSQKSYSKWLLMMVLGTPAGRKLLEDLGYDELVNFSHFVVDIDAKVELHTVDSVAEPKIHSNNANNTGDKAVKEQLEKIFSYKYPYEELRQVETKTSVSQLTKRNAGREFCATARPAFLSSGGLTPTERGTALHKFMQYANFTAALKDVSAEIDRLYEYEYISLAEAEAIDRQRVENFMQSDLFKRILSCDKLFREQRFLLDVKAGEIYPELSGFAAEQTVIIQGAVDCMFIEGDHIVIIDFKTDRTNDESFLLAHYAEQLKTYKIAAEKMFSLPVDECYIYSLHMSKNIKVI